MWPLVIDGKVAMEDPGTAVWCTGELVFIFCIRCVQNSVAARVYSDDQCKGKINVLLCAYYPPIFTLPFDVRSDIV